VKKGAGCGNRAKIGKQWREFFESIESSDEEIPDELPQVAINREIEL
jgi:hypothetical protein